MDESFGNIRATAIVVIFIVIGPLFGGIALNAFFPVLTRVGKPLDPYIFRSLMYWVFVYAYGFLPALSVGGVMAAYGGGCLRFRVVIIVSVTVGAVFCTYVFWGERFGPHQLLDNLRLISVAMAIHVIAGVSTLALSKSLLRL